MEIKTVEETVTIEKNVYIAFDGKEFLDCIACQQYEEEIYKSECIRQAEELRIKNFDFLPINTSGEVSENNVFCWYNVETEEQFKILNKAYSNCLKIPKVYPEIYCVENCGYEEYENDAYDYTLTEMKNATIEFWERLGYRVEIIKE